MSYALTRRAQPRDAEAIARFHVHVWRHALKDLAPAEAYAALDEKHRHRYWSKKLADSDAHQCVLIAEINQEIVGVGAAGRPSEKIYEPRAEIKNLYIHPEFQRRGIGRRLLADLAVHLKTVGYTSAALGVVKGNEAACRFYQALKARPIGEFRDAGPIWRSQNIVYAWDDINDLIPP